jgi:Domain of unknown function (DUF4397)
MLKLVAAALALSLTFAACTPMISVANANLRVAHLSPDAPKVDVWLDGKVVPALTNVPFKTVSSYLKVPVGAHDIAVYVAGTTSSPVIDVKGITLEEKSYTVGAIGLAAGGKNPLTAKVFVDDLTPNAAKARVRVIHASPDAPNVDVAVQGGAVVAANLAYPNATPVYLELAAAPVYKLEIRAAGTTPAVLKFDTPQLDAGKVYTVFAVNILTKLEVVAVADATPTTAQ